LDIVRALRKAGSDGRKKKNAGFEELIHEQMFDRNEKVALATIHRVGFV
jgi:hypothetical protein